jgi:hypothetical protein
LCGGLRLSQAKTLAALVLGAMRSRRISLADVAEGMEDATTVKHRIKRIWRFLRNPKVDVVEGLRALVHLAAKHSGGRLVVAVDWVEIRQYKVLRAAVPLRGRSVPIAFAVANSWSFFMSQNAYEEGFFLLLKGLLPKDAEVVIIADRGFARAELGKQLGEMGLHYVIRVCGVVYFDSPGYRGLLRELGLLPGQHQDLGSGLYCEERPVQRRVVAYWARRQLEPWLLGTDLDWPWRLIVAVFEQRMMIEELFRDEKNIRYGWGLRQLRLSSSARMQRMFLVLAFAYILLLLMGLICKQNLSAANWSSTTSKRKPTSAFVVGRRMQLRRHFTLRELLALFDSLLLTAAENWG